jgi:hypothetical protein
MSILQSDLTPIESAVIGEMKDNPDQLLLLGDNGAYYAYSIAHNSATEVEPDDNWVIEEDVNESLFS